MRTPAFVFAAALLLTAAEARAQAESPPAPQAEPPICTTTTVVVKKGDVVLSTNSTTKCENQGQGGGLGGGIDAGAVLKAPATVLKALPLTDTPLLSATHVRGYWRAPQPGASKICKLALLSGASTAGYAARATDCTGALAGLKSWRFEDGGVGLYEADGGLIARVTGDRDRLSGTASDGEPVVMER